jgi:hypothetical protein
MLSECLGCRIQWPENIAVENLPFPLSSYRSSLVCLSLQLSRLAIVFQFLRSLLRHIFVKFRHNLVSLGT